MSIILSRRHEVRKLVRTAGSTFRGILGESTTAGKNVVDPFDFAQDRFLLVFGGFSLFFSIFCRKLGDFYCQ
jgi:hypothetical protein